MKHKTTNEIVTWGDSIASGGQRKSQHTTSLEPSSYAGVFIFPTETGVNFSDYELYDVKFESNPYFLTQFPNCKFDLELRRDNQSLGLLHYDASQAVTDGEIVGGYYPKKWWGSYQNTKS